MSINIYEDGQSKPMRAVLRVMRDKETGQIVHIIGRLFDFDDESYRGYALRRSPELDSLTGLHHAESFYALAETLLLETDQQYAMIMIDIDGFKSINEEYGHIEGNNYLKETSDRLRYMLRNEDLIARIGGDEFLVLAQIDKDQESVIERLQENLSIKDDDGPHATVSIGVSFTKDVGHDYAKLLNACDKALYSAKHKGKNCCVIYENSMSDVMSTSPSKIRGTQKIYGWRRTDIRADERSKQ